MTVSVIVVALAVGSLFVCFTLIRPVRDCSEGCSSCVGATDCVIRERRSDAGH